MSLALYPVELVRKCLAYVFHGNEWAARLPNTGAVDILAFFVIRLGRVGARFAQVLVRQAVF